MTYIKDTFVRHVDSIFVPKCIYERILDGFVRVVRWLAAGESSKKAEKRANCDNIDERKLCSIYKWNKISRFQKY